MSSGRRGSYGTLRVSLPREGHESVRSASRSPGHARSPGTGRSPSGGRSPGWTSGASGASSHSSPASERGLHVAAAELSRPRCSPRAVALAGPARSAKGNAAVGAQGAADQRRPSVGLAVGPPWRRSALAQHAAKRRHQPQRLARRLSRQLLSVDAGGVGRRARAARRRESGGSVGAGCGGEGAPTLHSPRHRRADAAVVAVAVEGPSPPRRRRRAGGRRRRRRRRRAPRRSSAPAAACARVGGRRRARSRVSHHQTRGGARYSLVKGGDAAGGLDVYPKLAADDAAIGADDATRRQRRRPPSRDGSGPSTPKTPGRTPRTPQMTLPDSAALLHVLPSAVRSFRQPLVRLGRRAESRLAVLAVDAVAHRLVLENSCDSGGGSGGGFARASPRRAAKPPYRRPPACGRRARYRPDAARARVVHRHAARRRAPLVVCKGGRNAGSQGRHGLERQRRRADSGTRRPPRRRGDTWSGMGSV